jgi:hypothetical protein
VELAEWFVDSTSIEFTETGAHSIGAFGTPPFVFTGTNPNGFAELPLGGGPVVMRGSPVSTSTYWIAQVGNTSESVFHLYGVSEVLTVGQVAAIPEPTSAGLLSLATLGGVGLRLWRNRMAKTIA